MRRTVLISAIAFSILSCAGNQNLTQDKFETIYKEVKEANIPDSRSKTFEASLEEQDGKLILFGSTTEPKAKEALIKGLNDANIKVLDSMEILPSASLGDAIYGVASQSVINFRTSGKYSAESATQVMMGTPLQILEKEGGWTRAITPEGYIAWVTSGSIAYMNKAEYDAYKVAPKVIVTSKYTVIYNLVDDTPMSDAVWGNILLDLGKKGNLRQVSIADGRVGYVNANDVSDFNTWLASRKASPENIIATAKQFMGIPYMWGGTSIKAVDCSGFTKSVFFLNGLVLARDASQQCYTGENIDISSYVLDNKYTIESLANLKKGDLIFFGSKATADKKEKITHVGIYIENGEFIHSAGKVRINNLLPDKSNYYESSPRLVRAQRIIDMQDKNLGISSIQKLY